MIFNKKILKNNFKINGFTILEVMAAVSILSIGIVGLISLFSFSFITQGYNKNAMIAAQLAQEGLELVRNKRDNNQIQKIGWNKDFSENQFKIDYKGNFGIVTKPEPLNIDSNGFYSHENGIRTIFSRSIKFSDLQASSTNVTAVVSWKERGREKNYSITTSLYEWNFK